MHDEPLEVQVTPGADKLLEIVRRLAASDPYQQRPTTIGFWPVCVYCKLPKFQSPHGADCLWKAARDALDAR